MSVSEIVQATAIARSAATTTLSRHVDSAEVMPSELVY